MIPQLVYQKGMTEKLINLKYIIQKKKKNPTTTTHKLIHNP